MSGRQFVDIWTMCILSGASELTYGNEISIGDVAHIPDTECEQSARPARSRNEFDLKTSWLVSFDDCTKIADSQAMLREIAIENDNVQL